MLDKQFYVYVHMRADDDAVFYVGKGCKNRYKTKQGRNKYWQRVVAKHGFIAEIIRDEMTFEEANAYEIFLIKKLRSQGISLCNLTDGGEGCLGLKKTEAQKKAISKKNKGRKWSEESKAKMLNNKNSSGIKRSEEVKQKISQSKKGWNGRKGFKTSEETKQKIKESRERTEQAKKAMRLLLLMVMQNSKEAIHD